MSETSPLANNRSEISSLGWQGRLDEADTAHELASVARDFLATWTPEEIVQLPKSLRPWKIVDADDVTSYAIQLAQDDGAGQITDSALLDRATGIGRVLFSQDKDLLREAKFRQRGAHISMVPTTQSADLRAYYSKHIKNDHLDSKLLARLPLLHPEGLREHAGDGPADPLRRVVKIRSSIVKRRSASSVPSAMCAYG